MLLRILPAGLDPFTFLLLTVLLALCASTALYWFLKREPPAARHIRSVHRRRRQLRPLPRAPPRTRPSRLLVVQRVRHCIRLVPKTASVCRKVLFIRGCQAQPWRISVDARASIGDVLRKIQRLYGVRYSDASLYVSTRRAPLAPSESIASLGLDSLSVLSWIPRLRGGAPDTSDSEPEDESATDGTSGDVTEEEPWPKRKRATRKKGTTALSDADAAKENDATLISDAKASWTSKVYDHYDVRVSRKTQDGMPTLAFLFRCRAKDPEHNDQIRARNENSTGNLKKTAKSCDDRRAAASGGTLRQQTIEQAVSRYTEQLHRAIVAMRTAVSNRTFTALEDKYYRLEVELLRPGTHIFHRTTVSRDVKYLHRRLRDRVKVYFKEYKGAVHVVIDGWTAPNIASYLGIVLVWWAQNKINRSILEFDYLTESHTGEHLAERLAKCLKDYNVKPLTLCADNATNNDKLVRFLPDHIPEFGGKSMRVRCFAHIINLMAKAYISFFFEKPKKRAKAVKIQTGNKRSRTYVEDEEECDTGGEVIEDPDGIYSGDGDDEVDAAKEAHDEAAVTRAAAEAYSAAAELGIVVADDERRVALGLFPKVAGLARRVHDATVLAARFKDLVEKDATLVNKTNKRHLDRRVPTRWNSDLTCLDAHLLLREPVKTLTSDAAYDLAKFKLTPGQWTLADALKVALELFEAPTKVFSKGKLPLVQDIIPVMEYMELELEKGRNDAAQPPIMRVAAIAALNVLGKYYAHTDDSEVYRIAIIMCPHRKMKWFETQNTWHADDIAEARRMVIARWNTSYRGEDTVPPSAPARVVKKKSAFIIDDLDDDDDDLLTSASTDNIHAYLDAALVPRDSIRACGGLMPYWEGQRKHSPRVAQFALDFLSTPATSVDVERAFSNGRMKIGHLQHNKSTATFQAQMALGSWDDTPFWPGIDVCADLIKESMPAAAAARAPAAAQVAGSSQNSAIAVE